MKRLAIVLLSAVVVGCTSNPPGGEANLQPVSMQNAVNEAAGRAKVHVDLGMSYLREGQLNVAQDEARLAVEADSSYPLAYSLLGLVHMGLKEDGAAEAAFRRALQLAPTDPEVNNNFGWFLCQTKREHQSIPYFVVASKSPLYTEPTKPLTNAGICSVNMKDDKGAEEFLGRALRADPANPDAHFLLADIYFRSGRYGEARARMAELHRLAEASADSNWLALRIERKLGDREAEMRYATQLRRKFQNSPQYQKLMQGQFE